MSQERYFIGPGLKDKLRDVIFRVNSAPHVTSGPHVPHVYSDIPPPIAKAKELRRGTFTGSWSIGGTNTVQVVGSGETVRVTNYCTPILIDDGPTQRFSVIFGDVKGTQTAVEIQNPGVPGLRRGTFTGAWSIGSTNAVTIHGTTQTISVTNYCVPVAASTQPHNVIFGAVMGHQAAVEVQADAGLRVGKYTGSPPWAIGTCATVTLWERTGTNCLPTASSPTETVEAVANLLHDVPANSWVVIGQGTDGKWYLLDSGIEGSCRQTIGGEDITRWTGWDGTKVQLLGHDENGCLKWFDSEECEEPSPGTP